MEIAMNVSWIRRAACVWFFLALTWCLGAEGPTHAPLPLSNPLQDKNFYLLSVIERTPAARTMVGSNAMLAKIAAEKRAALSEAVRNCAPAPPAGGAGPGGGGPVPDVACYTKALRWTDDEISRSRAALGALAADGAIRQLVEGPVRQSGLYQRYSDKPTAALLEQTWEDAARKMNTGIDLYALGKQPPHQFDGPAYDVKSPEFARTVQLIAAVLDDDAKSLELFFQPSMRFVLELLRAQLRDEAGRHEPLEAGENRAAVRRVPTIRWAKFPYTVILVLGQGPDRAGVPLAPGGRLRLLPAVKAYREGKAPFILVSGGYVHPPLTPYSEAIEMKKALMTEFGVPEDAILVDPHARLTVTNMRNGARLIYRYGIPFDSKALVVSAPSHISSVEKAEFRDNLGYRSYKVGARISPFELEFVPQIEALNTDLSDLLDP
jgi:hypothetical protein